MKKKKVIVLVGGPSSEHAVSLKTGGKIFEYLDKKKYSASLVCVEKNGTWRFSARTRPISLVAAMQRLLKMRPDIVFIAMHGAFGEDGRIQALLTLLNIPYTGSGVVASATAMDKVLSNYVYEHHGIPVPTYTVVTKNQFPTVSTFPVVVKPVCGGSSIGISVAKNTAELRASLTHAFKESDRVLVQTRITGREITCGVLEDAKGAPFALPPTEIIPQSSHFFDYTAKYIPGRTVEITPAKLSKVLTKKIQNLAQIAHSALGCSGMSRSDFILKGSTFYILETNTIPGMTETSLLPQAAHAAGISFPKMLDGIINAGLRTRIL